MLCKLCDSLNATDLFKLAKANSEIRYSTDNCFYFEHHKRYDDLIAAASSGCELCLLLQQQCEEEEIEGGFTREQDIRNMEAEGGYMNLRVGIVASSRFFVRQKFKEVKMFNSLAFVYRRNMHTKTSLFYNLQTPRDQRKFIEGVRIGQFALDGNFGSETNFDIARGWMNTCISEHSQSECPPLEDKILPSRVISVGAKDADPFLTLTNGFKGKYITLSHCWGGQIDTILTTSNLQSFQNKIEMSSLPANFRDAVLITRALGIEFLWIDSLCIIQDSKYDWEVESKKMGDVYRNCVLTIAAAASHEAADGILRNAPGRQCTKPTLKLSKNSGPDDVVEIVGAKVIQEDLEALFTFGPLQSRAWVLQEKILSPRTLWYGSRQIYWQCLCGYQSADGTPSSQGDLLDLKFNETPMTQKIIHFKSYSDESPNISETELSDINHEYQIMVNDYCSRNLSYPTDKLPAFSGIAALMHQTIGGHYLAGIWSKYFRENLLWCKRGSKASHTKPYRAPSWSWAVTDDEVVLDNSIRLISSPYDPVLISHHVEPSSENPYGSVKYAHIIVNALTVKLFSIDLNEGHNKGVRPIGVNYTAWDEDGDYCFLNSILPPEEEDKSKIRNAPYYLASTKEIYPDDRIIEVDHLWERINSSSNSPLNYKLILIGFKKRTSCYPAELLILQEDPENAKICSRVGYVKVELFLTTKHSTLDFKDWDTWLTSGMWKRETLKLI